MSGKEIRFQVPPKAFRLDVKPPKTAQV